MKKLLALSLAMLFIGVGIASATDFTLTGSYFARGTWVDNWDGTGSDAVNKKNQYGVYDHELNLDANWQISPYTKVFARFELRDEDWGVSSNPTESYYGSNPDDNVYAEYVYGQHTFADGKTTVRAGLHGTSAWASDFGNNGTEAYRLMLIKMTDIGQFIFFTEKPQNTYSTRYTSSGWPPALPAKGDLSAEQLEEDNDRDDYVVALVTKMGDTTLMPIVKYVKSRHSDVEVLALDFGANGSFNNIGWEAELIYSDYDYENNAKDYSVWGAFVDVWAQLNAFKVGGFIAYGSYDEDVNKGFSMGDDFVANGAMILGDELMMYNNNDVGINTYAAVDPNFVYQNANAITAATVLGAYVSYAASEKLTVSAYVGYADSEVDNPANKFDGASAWEVNVQGEYKITDNVTYSVGAAQAQLEYGDATPDPDEAIELFHKLAFSF